MSTQLILPLQHTFAYCINLSFEWTVSFTILQAPTKCSTNSCSKYSLSFHWQSSAWYLVGHGSLPHWARFHLSFHGQCVAYSLIAPMKLLSTNWMLLLSIPANFPLTHSLSSLLTFHGLLNECSFLQHCITAITIYFFQQFTSHLHLWLLPWHLHQLQCFTLLTASFNNSYLALQHQQLPHLLLQTLIRWKHESALPPTASST